MKKPFIILASAITLAAASVGAIQARLEQNRQQTEASFRAFALLAGVEDSVRNAYEQKQFGRIQRVVDRVGNRERIVGLTLCFPKNDLPSGTLDSVGFPKLPIWDEVCREAAQHAVAGQGKVSGLKADLDADHDDDHDAEWTSRIKSGRYHLYSRPLFPIPALTTSSPATASPVKARAAPTGIPATLVLAQDLTYLRAAWVETFWRGFGMTWLVTTLIVLLIASQMRAWLKSYFKFFYHTLRALSAGRKPSFALARELMLNSGIASASLELEKLSRKILTLPNRQATAKAPVDPLLAELRAQVQDRNVVIIANREPYIHNRKGDKIEVLRPASGLVTALEPILRQCGGLWVGHGSGSADRETSDSKDEVAVPPKNPSYRLKRVWLTPEEEEGYYYGFANEGLWPLCHLAHNRPTFRLTDWEKYNIVNRRFAEKTPDSAMTPQSMILVQDYHFALLPRLLLDRGGPNGPKISLFWHIPWPNPEAFGICPWSKDLLKGMLGAHVIGFHTQYHCNNFLESCDRYLEARVDWENFSVTMDGHETLVRAFPIGIETPQVKQLSDTEVQELKAKFGIKAEIVAVGVDRIDYTKGLVERVEAVGRFLEKNPEYIGRFSLAQMGSPSRTNIPAYKLLGEQLEAAVKRVNSRFSGNGTPDGYLPVVLISQHHEFEQIQYFYQMGDVCMVTSLHDGMNLVAKEYVWCQKPERGSLILSKFAGASRELSEAFIVNPYSIEEMADALAASITMSSSDKASRMRSMKEKIAKHNAFHWAGDIIRCLANDVKNPSQFTVTGVGPGLTGNPKLFSRKESESGKIQKRFGRS